MWRIWIIFALMVSVPCGCAVGPDYVSPDSPSPASWLPAAQVEDIAESQTVSEPPVDEWWSLLGDPTLEDLIDRALDANHDVAVALARVRRARALRSVKASVFFPNISGSATYSVRRGSENAMGPGSALARRGIGDLQEDLYEAALDASWEIDVFGAVRRSVEASEARIDSSIENMRDVLISVTAEVAVNYLELKGTQRRLAVVERNVRIQSETLELVKNRFKTGLGDELETAQAQAQLMSTRARRAPLRAAIRSAAYRIAVLTGRLPGERLTELLEAGPTEIPKQPIAIGIPSELLLRRPDLRRAERDVAAAVADVGVATADLYPRFFLTGAAGVESVSLSDFLTFPSRTFSFGPSVRWPIFRGGRIRANIRVSQEDAVIALESYHQAILQAFEDVESSLTSFREARREARQLADSVQAAERAARLAGVLYRKGLKDFLTVLDAERRLVEVQDLLAAAETRTGVSLVRLYKALGGGWQIHSPVTKVELE